MAWKREKVAPAARLAVLVIVGLTGSCVAPMSAGAHESSCYTYQANRVLELVVTNLSGTRYEKPPAGIRGDVVVGRERLRNALPQFGKPKGSVVGQSRYRSVFKSAVIASVEVTATLPGGTIRARGKADFRRASNVIRVVAGTGVFAGATGTVEERELPSGQTLNIYRLRGVR